MKNEILLLLAVVFFELTPINHLHNKINFEQTTNQYSFLNSNNFNDDFLSKTELPSLNYPIEMSEESKSKYLSDILYELKFNHTNVQLIQKSFTKISLSDLNRFQPVLQKKE